MKNIFSLLFLIFVFIQASKGLKAQQLDSLIISSETTCLIFPSQIDTTTIKSVEDELRTDLDIQILEFKKELFISENVIISANLDHHQNKLIIYYEYQLKDDTISLDSDDFGLGQYLIEYSRAASVMLSVMKQSIEDRLSQYIPQGKNVSFYINGNADAVPIRNTIPYNGEFGNPIADNCSIGAGDVLKMNISKEKGITANIELAFIRSYAFRDYIIKQIPSFQKTKNVFYHRADVSQYRGGEYRRVSIKIIVHDVFLEKN